MKKIFLPLLILSIAGAEIFVSCKKDPSCEGCINGNRPPTAIAGPDQVITLPTNTFNLDGGGSTDPENNITSYLWTKISGPATFNIVNVNAVETQVYLLQGVYQFELKVTDAGGLFSKDTMNVTCDVQPPPPPPPLATCEPLNRPIINMQLTPFGNLSVARAGMIAVAAENKIFYAGGYNASGLSSRVDIYTVANNTWSVGELSIPRNDIAAVACVNKVFFAGGSTDAGMSSRVDIYDITTQAWSTAELSEARWNIVTATVGNKVFFAGGLSSLPYSLSSPTNKVDIYDLSSNTWSTANLSTTRIGFTATTAGSKIYFAGGWNTTGTQLTSAIIDIYDDTNGMWSTSSLNFAKAFHAGIFKNGKIYWVGGDTYIDDPWMGSNEHTCSVEIKDVNSQSTTSTNLSNPIDWVGWNGAFERDNNLVFIKYQSLSGHLDIYDITANSWSLGKLIQPASFYSSAYISHNNTIYVAGGWQDSGGGGLYTNQVWKLEF